MTEQEDIKIPVKKDPAKIPMEDRIATITIIWTKDNQIFASTPTEAHIALPMLAASLKAVAEREQKKFMEMKILEKKMEISRIIPATNIPVGLDPTRFMKKPR